MDKIAYLRGLLDGLGDDLPSAKVFNAVVDALDALAERNLELEDRVAELEELCEILDEDLGEVEDFLTQDDETDLPFDCRSCGCGDDFDDEPYETICPTCGECVLLDEKSLEDGETVCPNCGEQLEFDFDEAEIEALAPAESEE